MLIIISGKRVYETLYIQWTMNKIKDRDFSRMYQKLLNIIGMVLNNFKFLINTSVISYHIVTFFWNFSSTLYITFNNHITSQEIHRIEEISVRRNADAETVHDHHAGIFKWCNYHIYPKLAFETETCIFCDLFGESYQQSL